MSDIYEIENPAGDQPGQLPITPEVQATFAEAMGLQTPAGAAIQIAEAIAAIPPEIPAVRFVAQDNWPSVASEVLLMATFASGVDGFSAGTQVDGEGNDLSEGYLSVASNTSPVVTFAPQTSGIVRVDFAIRADDSETETATSAKNIGFYLGDSDTAASASAAGTILFTRQTDNVVLAATANSVAVQYRNGATFTALHLQRRAGWHHWAIEVDVAARTYSIYYEGILWIRGITSPDTTFTEISKILIVNGSTAPEFAVDSIRVSRVATTATGSLAIADDFTVGTGSVSSYDPDASSREFYPQKWMAPTHPDTVGFTRDVGGVAPSGSLNTFNVTTAGAQGTWRQRWVVPSSGNTYCGLAFNCYEVTGSGLGTEDAYYLLRYSSNATAGQQLRLFKGTTFLAQSDGTAGGVSYGADTTHEFRVVRKGRYIWCYVDGQIQFGGPILDQSNVRGLIGEEGFAPYLDGALGSAKILSCSYSGPRPKIYAPCEHGDLLTVTNQGAITEMYVAGSTQNLFAGKGIQTAHRSTCEPSSGYATARVSIIDEPNVRVERLRGLFLREDNSQGIAEVYFTKTRRGVYASDSAVIWGTTLNWGPDFDLRPEIFRGASAYGYSSAGAATEVAWTTNHTWTTRVSSALPQAFQAIGTLDDGRNVRLTVAYRNNSNLGGTLTGFSKHKGNGDPLSYGLVVLTPTETTYVLGICYLVEVGSDLAIDNDVANGLRTAIGTPILPTISSGSLRTSETGDADADGFNERFGWIEITSNSAGGFFGSYAAGSLRVPRLQFRVHGYANATTVLVNGVIDLLAAVDDLGDGTAIVTLGATITGTQTVELL